MTYRTFAATPCTADGEPLPPGAPPPARSDLNLGGTVEGEPEDSFGAFGDKVGFELADLLYREDEMSAPHIDKLMELWAEDKIKHDDLGPFRDAADMYAAIDSIKVRFLSRLFIGLFLQCVYFYC